MRSRTVTRYYCDFCSRGGLQACAMVRHEGRCFYNPARVCELCKDDQIAQKPIDELRAALRDGGIEAAKALAEGCPACICSAVIQQRKADAAEGPEYLVWYEYDYKAGLQEWYSNERGKYADRYVGAYR